jgi:hypothetical protein
VSDNLNRTIAEPFGIPSKTIHNKESYYKFSDLSWDRIKEKSKTLFTKELVFMLSVSAAWFLTFLYFVLYVFT